ncbi:helix-turn-helix transcriptional regulator [Candidatus Saccharibacteria bacterium]|jgi:transcriptional regulator with XRE-family HTH domain|nr:helix-turn-helix transcriptional regulator [Candidatus Saccharibacteria bacterium]
MIGQRLKLLREEKGLKQVDIAEMLGVSRTTYTQYETEKSEPDLATVTKLASYFGVSTDFLLGKTNIRTPIETIAAHHDGEEWTEEELKEIERFKEFVRMKRQQKDKNNSSSK